MKLKKNNIIIMFITVILIWVGVAFANLVIYEILKPKDDKPIVYTHINEVTEGWRELLDLEPPF